MSIRINVGATFDARDLKAARRELDALEDKANGLSESLGRSMRSFQRAGDALVGVGVRLTSSVTVPLIGAAGASVAAAASFQESMSRITGLVGIAADEVKGMEASVLALSGETAKSPQELAQALFVVTSAGLRGKAAMDALSFAAKAGAAGLGATNDIARAVAGAMNAYGAETLSAARATDIIVATARAGNFATDQFAGALGRVLPFANQAQASLEDVGGAVALLTRTNGNAAESITQVQALLRAFVVPTEQAKLILDEAGISAAHLRDVMGRRGLVEALRTLDRAVGGNREVLGRLLSSTEAASAAFQILNADANTLESTFGVVTDSVGMTDEAFGVVTDQSAFKFQQALNDLRVASITLGETLLPIVTDMVEAFGRLVGKFVDLDPKSRNLLITFGALAAIAGPVLLFLGGVFSIASALIPVIGLLAVKVAVATAGLSLLAAVVAGVAFNRMLNGAEQVTTEMRRMEAAAYDAELALTGVGQEFLEARRARVADTEATRMSGLAARYAETGFSALSREQRDARRATEALTGPTGAVADALAALGDAANGDSETTSARGGASAKVAALTGSLRGFFQQLNETNVGASRAGDMIAQFSREVLSAGQITNETARGAENLARAIRQDVDKALSDANRKLEEATGRFNSFRDAIANGIRSGNTLRDAVTAQASALEVLARAEEDYERAQVSGDPDRIEEAAAALAKAQDEQKTFLDFLQVGVTSAEGFAAQIDALRDAGASMEVVQQIAELGARTGSRIAEELLAGGAEAIEQANRMVTAVEQASQRAGQAAARQFFGAGVAAARALVAGIEATLPELQSVLDRIAEAIERAIGTRPNVDISGRTGPFIPPGSGTPSPSPNATPTPTRTAPAQAGVIGQIVDPGTIRFFADGGLVLGPTFGVVGEAGPELVIPLDRLDSMGGQTVVNVTVTSADPQAVVEALRRYTRANGPLGQVVAV
jgi:TP901 family phage tail tape measure protein